MARFEMGITDSDDRPISACAERFFDRAPRARPIYAALERALCDRVPGVRISVQKTQISFSERRAFAWAWLPVRTVKGRPDVYLIVSFGLSRRIDDPRITEATEVRPDRWTHHVIVASEKEIDAQLMDWMEQAYRFRHDEPAGTPG